MCRCVDVFITLQSEADIGDHLGILLLNELILSKWPTELTPVQRVDSHGIQTQEHQ